MSKIDSAWNQPHINHYPFDFESNIFEKTTGELTDEGIIQYKIEEEDSEIKKLWEKVKEIGKDLKIQKDCVIDEEYILQNREQNEKLLECLNDILAINDSLPVILYNKGACLARLNRTWDMSDEVKSLFRKAVKEKSDYVIGFRALSERLSSHIDSLLWKYAPDEAVRYDDESSLFFDIAQQFENMSEKHWFFDDYWGMGSIEDIFVNARECVDKEMFEVSLLLFNAYLTVAEFGYVVDDDEKERCMKERDEVVKRLSDHF